MDKRKRQSVRGKTKVKNLKLLVLSLSLAFFVSNFTLCFAQDKIVAIVNQDIITQKDLNDFLNFMRMQLQQEYSGKELESKIQSMKLDLLNKLIEDRLILQEAKRYKVIVDEARIKAKIDEIRRKYPTDADFQNSLKQQGLILADMENKIREQFLMFNMIEYKIRMKTTVSPLEVTDFYEKNIEEFNLGEERNFNSVSTSDEEAANEAYGDLKRGASLKDAAGKYALSLNKLSASRLGELKKEIEDAVFKLNAGDISQPLKLYDNFYIFQLESISPSRQLSLAESRDKIYSFLINKKIEAELAKWLDELKKRTYIKFVQD